jgi:membrane protease YdiL (CAAX protease family)
METRTESSGSRLRLVGVCFGLAIGGMGLGIAVLVLAALLVFAPLGLTISPTASLVLSLVAIQGIAFPGTALLYFRYTNRSLREFVPVAVPSLREIGITVSAWIGALVLVVIGANVVIQLVGTEPAGNAAAETAADNPEFIPVLIVLVFLLNAPGEELLFRGVIQGLLRERFGPVGAIGLATAAFAPIHITALIGSVEAALVTITILSIPSIVFGAVYELTDNIAVPTLVHALYNATLFAGLYAVSTGGVPTGG